MSSSFVNPKKIRFTFTLAIGSFEDGSNQVIIEGFRSAVDIQKAGGSMMVTATAKIWGLSQDVISRLTTLAYFAFTYAKNTIKIEAIDGDTVTTVYTGSILNAWADYSSMPDVFLYIETQVGHFNQLTIDKTLEYQGVWQVSDLMEIIANRLGVAFENNNVTKTINNPKYNGSLIDQLRQLGQDTQTDFYLDNNVLAICPRNTPRTVGQNVIPIVSDKTGMIGYPTFNTVGIIFRTLFNPAIVYGGQITVESDIKQANGLWQTFSINHYLESEKPDGQWFSTITCLFSGLVPR